MMLQSAIVLVLDPNHRILCVDNTAHGGVGMPGGKVEPDGETIVQAAIRELREETALGVQAKDLHPIYSASWRFKRRDGAMGPERLAHLLYASRVEGHAHAMEADTALHHLSYSELLARSPFADYYRKALQNGEVLLRLTPTVRA
jgi:8-oxo-dGTP pyrophosphatase MutT (NUDIX family)